MIIETGIMSINRHQGLAPPPLTDGSCMPRGFIENKHCTVHSKQELIKQENASKAQKSNINTRVTNTLIWTKSR